MAATNKTPNYNLPQWGENDTIEFTPDMNNAFSAIDIAVKANAANIGLLLNSQTDMIAADSGSHLNVLKRLLPSLTANQSLNVIIKGRSFGSDAVAYGLKTSDLYASFLVHGYNISPANIKCVNGVWTSNLL